MEDRMVAVFNEWMRRYTEEPEEYKKEWQTVVQFLAEQNEGKTPSYGVNCTRYYRHLYDELYPGPYEQQNYKEGAVA